jgi:hypothetical protein
MNKEVAGVFVGPDDGKALVNPIGGRMVAKLRDPAVRERLAAFTARYGYEFAELPPG